MKPMILLAPNQMTEPNIKQLRDNGICVAVAKDPSKIRFVDPIPAMSSRTQIENAAIKLSRLLLNGQWSGPSQMGAMDFAKLYVELLIEGTPLDKNGTIEEQEEGMITFARQVELQKIGREEARASRAAKKAQES